MRSAQTKNDISRYAAVDFLQQAARSEQLRVHIREGNKFVSEKLGLEREQYTTQISNYDYLNGTLFLRCLWLSCRTGEGR